MPSRKEFIVKRVEARLGKYVIGGYKNICMDCLEQGKEGMSREWDQAFICWDCITIRSQPKEEVSALQVFHDYSS